MFYTIPNQMKFWVTLAGDNRGDSISQNCFFLDENPLTEELGGDDKNSSVNSESRNEGGGGTWGEFHHRREGRGYFLSKWHGLASFLPTGHWLGPKCSGFGFGICTIKQSLRSMHTRTTGARFRIQIVTKIVTKVKLEKEICINY